jgi:hypothetical protein
MDNELKDLLYEISLEHDYEEAIAVYFERLGEE